MASIASVKSALYRTASTIEGDITLEVSVSETEASSAYGTLLARMLRSRIT